MSTIEQHLEVLSKSIEDITSHLSNNLSVSNFNDLLNSEEKMFVGRFANMYINSINTILTESLAVLKFFEERNINPFIVARTAELQKEIDEINRKQNDTNSKLEKQIRITKELEEKSVALLEAEDELKRLSQSKDEIQEKYTELNALKDVVDNNGLVKLDQEINVLEDELRPHKDDYNIKVSRRNKLIEEKANIQKEIQQVLDETKFIGNSDSLLKEIKDKCEAHNKNAPTAQHKEAVELGIRLEFNLDTSGAIIDDSAQSKLDTAKNLITDVEKKLKERIERESTQE